MSHGESSRAVGNVDDDRSGLDASPLRPPSPDAEITPEQDDDQPEVQTEALQDRLYRKRNTALRDILTNLDTFTYIELAALYYLDTSTTLFILRCLVQMAQLTSILSLPVSALNAPVTPASTSSSTSASISATISTNPSASTTTGTAPILDTAHQQAANLLPSFPLPKPTTTGKPHIILILLVNLLCFVIHFLSAPPAASEATRFYLHGGILIDFIGQRAVGGWRARIRLCAMDVLIAVMQVAAVGVVASMQERKVGTVEAGRVDVESGELGDIVARFLNGTARSGRWVRGGGVRAERGIEEEEDIEMQPLRAADREEEEAAVMDERTNNDREEEASPQSILEVYSSGQAVITDINIVHVVRQQFYEIRARRLAGQV